MTQVAQIRANRTPYLQRLDPAISNTWLHYDLHAHSIKMQVFAGLEISLPTLHLERKFPGTVPVKPPIHEAFYGRIESNEKIYPVLVVVYYSLQPDGDNTTAIYLFDDNGQVVHDLELPVEQTPFIMCKAMETKLRFFDAGKEIESSRISTTIDKFDPLTLRQPWTSKISVPGLPPVVVGGDVNDLRKAGIDKPESYKCFKHATFVECPSTNTKDIVHLLAWEHSGKVHSITYVNGELVEHSPTKLGADFAMCSLASTYEQLKRN